MNRLQAWACLLSVVASGCGGPAPEDTPLAHVDQSIVRGRETDAFPQVVLLHVRLPTSSVHCTASYIAPRVVLTAAHCIHAGSIPGASYVYHGTGQAPGFNDFPEIPPPGEPSDFARVESFRVHPGYNPGVNYPDMAIAYLDRELPFAPLPLLTERIGRSQIGDQATIIGWGGSRALVADISQVEGSGIKRKGRATIVGTPTEADFHADDPNPGMLDPAIRADSIKLNGVAPSANTCAGDSGGPLLIQKHGRTFVAGVSFWTGLFCEDYSIFARIDPFLDFFDDALRATGREPIIARLECVDHAPDGTYTAFFGYDNQNGLTVEVPHSARNSLRGDDANARPESFGPGDHPWAFSVAFAERERLRYRLVPAKGPGQVVTADRNSPSCDCASACEASLAAECSDVALSRSACVAECAPFAQIFPNCQAELNGYWRCVAALPPAAENWICDPSFIAQPVTCQEEFFAALGCGGFL
jgi:secreted trypsin-like serine protease